MSNMSQQDREKIVDVLFGEGRRFSFRDEVNAREDGGLKGLPELSHLPADGEHVTSLAMSEWIDAVAERIRQAVGPGPVTCVLWSYRLGRGDNSHCNIAADWHPSDSAIADTGYSMTLAIDGAPYFRVSPSLSDPLMPDVAEAMHCIARIANLLGATIKLAV
ncbi:TPA: hypothetical protein UMZ04_001110 [Stenotrophomonas maltophilia]|jgi:hypothetical protein|nr:hypothetical protein [Stenotrophomonas maltophilia]HEL3845506.1 hypothetical protein [Stenotrophomonas maltophilia]HEL4292537.1 hypothetical protein [Stenotrophomonas maltophilia]